MERTRAYVESMIDARSKEWESKYESLKFAVDECADGKTFEQNLISLLVVMKELHDEINTLENVLKMIEADELFG